MNLVILFPPLFPIKGIMSEILHKIYIILDKGWCPMEIRKNLIVPLGYGKFVRSDKIIALEPIEENRGPGRRTRVFIEEMDSPIIASRTETSIISNIVETPREIVEAVAALELLQDMLDDIRRTGPMLRKSIREEAGLDLDKIETRIQEILKHEMDIEPT